MSKYSRRRRQRQFFLGNFYLNPSVQYLTTVISAIALAGFVFSGFLLFRFTDEEDLINRGKMQLMEGKVAWAEKTFEKLVSNHHDSYEGHLLLGQAYLQLDERRKAEQEFQLASSLKSPIGDNSSRIALSKVAMAQGDYLKAEKILYNASKEALKKYNRNDVHISQAFYELYEQWGDTLTEAEPKDYPSIIRKYEFALRYVNEYPVQENIDQKLVDVLRSYTDKLLEMGDYPNAILQLKTSLRFGYNTDTLVQLAETYDRMNQIDDSINAYREAFKANPSVVGLRLTSVLVQKGQQLVATHKDKDAQAYFDEADQVSKQAKVPLDSLYPTSIGAVKIKTDIDEATGEFSPQVSLNVSNDSSRPLNFMAVKVEFFTGDTLLATTTTQVAGPDSPLDAKTANRKHATAVTVHPDNNLNIHSLQGDKMTVKISIAYRDGADTAWILKSIQDTTVRPPANTNAEPKPV